VARIKESREALMQAFHKVTESIYRQSGAGAGSGAGPEQPGQETPPRDDTIEGEFQEM